MPVSRPSEAVRTLPEELRESGAGRSATPELRWGRGRSAAVAERLHVCTSVEAVRHRREIYMLPKTRGAFHFGIPDPQHICKSRGSPYKSKVCTQTTDRSTRLKDVELYLLSVITQDAFLTGFGPRAVP